MQDSFVMNDKEKEHVMNTKKSSFKWIVIALIAAIAVAGALFAVKNSGIQQAVDPNKDQSQAQQSLEIDPNNPPEGVQIVKNDGDQGGNGGTEAGASAGSTTQAS